ncbi:MAG: PAS domain S-box protein [Candidatus Bathyarchaeota archaeon]|nr:PAS domain S-box protein [Candidatus Bathyarchaeota archaeon]
MMHDTGREIIEAGASLRVLLVDDDVDLCDSLAEILRGEGIDVTPVNTGSMALKAVETGRFDAFIIDVRLPDIDGLEIQERLRQTDPDAGVLMLSGAAILEDVVESLNKGADAFILKPVDPEDLISKLGRVTRLKMLRRKLTRSEERFRGIAERSYDGIITLDPEARITYVSPSAKRIFGYDPTEMTGKPLRGFFPETGPPQLAQALEEVKGGVDVESLQLEITRKDGSNAYLEINASPIRRDDEAVGVQLIARDITERRLAEIHLRELVYSFNDVSPGECYLHSSHDDAYRIYADLALHGVPGLCLARDNPENLVLEYGLSPESVVLISSRPLGGFNAVSDLQGVSRIISRFLAESEAPVVVLLDGLEYLVSRFGFDAVYTLIQEKRFDFLEAKGVMLVPFDPLTVTDREKALLASEIKTLK